MATTDTTAKQLIINKLTQEQYTSAQKDPTQLYLVTDAEGAVTPTQLEAVRKDLQQGIDDNAGDIAALDADKLDKTEAASTYETKSDATAKKTELDGKIKTNADDIDAIEEKIPTEASKTNQLADKAFVNSTVQTSTANFRGNWATYAAIPTDVNSYPEDYAGSKTPTVNDYLVVEADENDNHGGATWRYKYTGVWATNGKAGWQAEYQINETPFTSAQLAAINSGVTADTVAQVDTNKAGIADNKSAIEALQAKESTFETTVANTYETKADATKKYGELEQAIETATDDMLTKTEAGTTYETKADATAKKTALETAIDKKQDKLTAGDNITIVGNVISAEEGLPDQTGNAGKYLTTDGTDASWESIDFSPYATNSALNAAKEELQGKIDLKADKTAIADMLTKTEASSTYLSQTDAASTYLSQTNAASTYETQTAAKSAHDELDGKISSLSSTVASTYQTKTDAANDKKELEEAIADATDDMLTKTEAGTTYETKSDATTKKTELDGKIKANADDIDAIEEKIPEAASSSNQLADKAFVNSTVQTNSANFRGAWATWAAVPTDSDSYPADYAGSKVPTTNDYLVVLADESNDHAGATWRYKYTGVWATNGKAGWQAEYKINDTPLTADQLKALNSGVTTETVAQVGTNKNDIANVKSDVSSFKSEVASTYQTQESAASDKAELEGKIAKKQDTLTAGANISLEGNSVAVVGTLPSERLAAGGTEGQALVKTATGQSWATVGDVTESELQNVQQTLQAAIDLKADKTAIADMLTKTEAGNTYATKESLTTELGKKQDKLTAGKNITISATNEISAADQLPSMTGKEGCFLTTDGTEASWTNYNAVVIRQW